MYVEAGNGTPQRNVLDSYIVVIFIDILGLFVHVLTLFIYIHSLFVRAVFFSYIDHFFAYYGSNLYDIKKYGIPQLKYHTHLRLKKKRPSNPTERTAQKARNSRRGDSARTTGRQFARHAFLEAA